MNCGRNHAKTNASAASTSVGLSKRLHSGRDTGAGDLYFTSARAHSEAVVGAPPAGLPNAGPNAGASLERVGWQRWQARRFWTTTAHDEERRQSPARDDHGTGSGQGSASSGADDRGAPYAMRRPAHDCRHAWSEVAAEGAWAQVSLRRVRWVSDRGRALLRDLFILLASGVWR